MRLALDGGQAASALPPSRVASLASANVHSPTVQPRLRAAQGVNGGEKFIMRGFCHADPSPAHCGTPVQISTVAWPTQRCRVWGIASSNGTGRPVARWKSGQRS